jgi:hypothetical protein
MHDFVASVLRVAGRELPEEADIFADEYIYDGTKQIEQGGDGPPWTMTSRWARTGTRAAMRPNSDREGDSSAEEPFRL